MNEQKDTQKTEVNSYGQNDTFGRKSLILNDTYDHAQKKTNKLITALYMVTDCMEVDDPIKTKLRALGVELMSNTYDISLLSPVEKQSQITRSLARVHEVISLIEIGNTIGFISEMNTTILKREFIALAEEWKSFQQTDSHFSFTLDENLLSVPEKPINPMSFIKDKRTDGMMSFTTKQTPVKSFSSFKKPFSRVESSVNKTDRSQKILDMIKEKGELSIKDISVNFTDCSEKTIQRELNTLVSKGQIKRTGAKRWSKYTSK